ncbi:unnamed protein product [Trifolium pratense]|uniref:Uncharacterized protein n=1 Tax=Trifolium pratense TaxID=57577 RepID=A0ACB0L1Z0_TRIPR|nr:unnamed protein product [Trifolium pratense]
MANNQVQNNHNNTLKDETSSQLRQTAQQGTQTNAIVNTDSNNCRVNNGTHPVRLNDNQNASDEGNSNNGNNGNDEHRGKGRNSEVRTSDDLGRGDYPYEDGHKGRKCQHPGKTSFTIRILESRILRALEKPPKLENYDGPTDLDEHVEHIYTVLDYYQEPGSIKCKLFVLTLKVATMTWFKGLEDNFIKSWEELNKASSSPFIAWKRQPKTITSLNNILKGKDESLRDYIERFTRKAIEVKGTNVKIKCYIFENGLRHDTKFKKKLGLKKSKDMQDLLSHAQRYINYEEKMLRERT